MLGACQLASQRAYLPRYAGYPHVIAGYPALVHWLNHFKVGPERVD